VIIEIDFLNIFYNFKYFWVAKYVVTDPIKVLTTVVATSAKYI
jgi:hypothetical protein